MVVAATALGRVRWKSRQRNAAFLNEAHDALAACRQLLELAGHLQQHRGLSVALLGGDASYQPKIFSKQNEVLTVIARLDSIAGHETKRVLPSFTTSDLTLFRQKWQSLTDGLKDLSPVQSIAQHSQLIARVLLWLSAYGQVHIELPGGGYLPPGAARSFYYGLPSLTETLGQARAIGMDVAVHGGCTQMARVRLMFLTTRAEYLLQRSASMCDPGPKGECARIAVQELLQMIRYEMLATSGVRIDTDQYYQLATAAIDSVFDWIEECGTNLESALHAALGRTVLQRPYGGVYRQAQGWS